MYNPQAPAALASNVPNDWTITSERRPVEYVVAGIGGEDTLECWISGDKIILREPGHPENQMPIDINNDGTLEVPIYGEFKKKGN